MIMVAFARPSKILLQTYHFNKKALMNIRGVCVCVCLGLHPTRLPLCGTKLGIRKSHPYVLRSGEFKSISTNQLY